MSKGPPGFRSSTNSTGRTSAYVASTGGYSFSAALLRAMACLGIRTVFGYVEPRTFTKACIVWDAGNARGRTRR
jgi:hypothetical protein